MKFNEIEYVQINFDELKEKYIKLIESLKDSKNKEEALSIVKEINKLDTEFSSYGTLASIRNSIDTSEQILGLTKKLYNTYLKGRAIN
jgi:oligoendopeptidase F